MSKPSPVLIMADAHLRGPGDPNQKAMVEFLRSARLRYSSLVLLGDFFEFMAGNNQSATRAFDDVLWLLGSFESLQVVEGNHDFDLNTDIPGFEKARIYSSLAVLELCGHRCLALHGDRASPKDIGTKALRALLQSGTIRFLRDHVLPDPAVFSFALWFAKISRKTRWPGRRYEEAFTLELALRQLQQSKADGVLFAHTHKARLEKSRFGFVANPGAASLHDGSYIHMDSRFIVLKEFPSGKTIKSLSVR